ncbi:MAG: sulfatase-like hydrolase/transferase, partial [bacterium]|nr:sulfatase-like hydrolase/transferase [bacterium]
GDEVFAQHGFEEWRSIEDGYSRYFSEGHDRGTRSSYHHHLAQLGYEPESNNRYSRGYACRRPLEHTKPAFLAQEASRFIHQNRADPWMLYVNFLEPHSPFFGPYDNLHSAGEAPTPDNCDSGPVEREPRFYAQNRNGQQTLYDGSRLQLNTPEAWQRLNRNYVGLCSQVDQALGRILWALESSGQVGNTIIVYTSDHGEQMGSHRLKAKRVMYEESVRVPWLLHVPFREQKPFRFDKPVSHIDMAPTLLDLLGADVPDHLPGKSLVRVLDGRQQQADEVFSEWHLRGEESNGRAIITADGWKMALYDGDHCLLFNRRDDPLELENLYYRSEHKDTVRALRSRIERWQRGVDDRQRLPEPV